MVRNKDITGMFEGIHLLRKLFVRRISETSPLHFSQVAIMKTIEQNENCTQATIAERLGVTPASVAISTKRLQKAGLITKTVDNENLRCKRLTLTEDGRDVIKRHISQFRDYDELVFAEFTNDEKQQLMGYLERIMTRMKDIEGIDGDLPDPIKLQCMLHKRVMDKDRENEE
ncbi:MAG: MarR family transcriptional regulator [Ruminococcus sp.]|nr:MarR family transcriptional regulator [Ruminococcus sp.]